jgi:hypothetical protein
MKIELKEITVEELSNGYQDKGEKLFHELTYDKFKEKKKPKITGDTVCATCWIRGQGHEIGMCHCGRGDFIDKGLLDYIILISKQQGYEQGKLDQSFLSTDKNLGKNEMTALIDILENGWEELKKKNPKIAREMLTYYVEREMLTYYVEMWNIPVKGYDNTAVIEMIWDGRLSNINANGYWFDNYEKQKPYYVASRLKSQISSDSVFPKAFSQKGLKEGEKDV